VTVKVGAAKSVGLSTRACERTLRGEKQSVTIATNATQIDVDAFGVDLGLGVPIAAFQIKNSGTERCTAYEIYSLEKPPRLLRTITGGGFFSAADTDMDGRVEIWTTDAAAVNRLDKLDLAELDFAPPIVLRFKHGDLLDASSEFQTYFDNQIVWLRKQLNPEDVRDFKNTDGKLSATAASSADRQHRLRQVKIKVLEIVWAYLANRQPGLLSPRCGPTAMCCGLVPPWWTHTPTAFFLRLPVCPLLQGSRVSGFSTL
jgi:hypothetical protein